MNKSKSKVVDDVLTALAEKLSEGKELVLWQLKMETPDGIGGPIEYVLVEEYVLGFRDAV